MLKIAMPKGRLGEKVYKLLETIGCGCAEYSEDVRKLVFTDEKTGVSYFWVKPSDVAVYVEAGAADIGVVGKDILLEQKPDVYELADLNTGKCRVAVAAPNGFYEDTSRPLKVATKFVNIAKEHFAAKNRECEIIELHGSIELAPLIGMSDVILDIVETGTTLKENDLSVLYDVCPISARLIANKVSYKFNKDRVDEITEKLKEKTE